MSFLTDLYRDTVTADEDGVYKGKGFGAFILKPFVDEESIESGRQQASVKRTFAAAGEDPADYNLGPGATTFDAQGAIASTRRKRASEKSNLEHSRSQELPMAQLKASTEAQKDSNQILREQMAQSDKRYFADKAEAREAKAMELEYLKMKDRREDMRYNERMEQLDRKDRRMAMQSLAAGLASLGAAFAL